MDLRFALRALRRSPGFTALAMMVMALGIGANTAVFSVVNAVLLRPLAYSGPDRIVVLSSAWRHGGGPGSIWKQVSIVDFQDWYEQSTAFDAMAYYAAGRTSVVAGRVAEYAQATRVSSEFFRVFRVEPIAGRFFSEEERKPRGGGAAIISQAYWQSHFAGNPNAIGQTVRMFERPLTIVGVMPAGFRFPGKTDVWFPADTATRDTAGYRSALNYQAIARLKAAVTLEQAQAQMTSIGARLEQQYPRENAGRNVAVTRLRDDMVSDVRTTLYLLLGAVGVVLLIACANLATLLLAKATGRSREMAIRAAVGASRARIARQLITESLVLALVSAVAGVVLAVWGSAALVRLAPSDVPRLAETGIDVWVLAFTLGVSVLASLLFGLAPALQASRVDLNEALKQGAARAVVGGMGGRLRSALVVAEIAMSVVLLTGAGLLIKSFVALQQVALGFRPENVLVMQTTMPTSGPDALPRANDFFKGLLSDVAALPGVVASGASMSPPGHVDSVTSYWIDHLPPQLDMSGTKAVGSIIAPGAFAALGVPLKNGRDFNDADNANAPPVAIVNEAVVRRSFQGENPIGRTIFCPFDSLAGMQIVGVVGDVRQDGPAHAPEPECFMPYQQHHYNRSTLSVVVRAASDPYALNDAMRRLVRNRSPEVSIEFTTMQAALAENIAPQWFRTLLLGVFAALALALAMAGVYGVMAYMVSRRSGEIGLRMALGARPSDIVRLILRQGLWLTALGLALGLAGAVAATRLLASLLFEVKPGDPLTYAGVAALLGVISLAACWVPARRAMKVDPLIALRQE